MEEVGTKLLGTYKSDGPGRYFMDHNSVDINKFTGEEMSENQVQFLDSAIKVGKEGNLQVEVY